MLGIRAVYLDRNVASVREELRPVVGSLTSCRVECGQSLHASGGGR